jgi:hypothetical protein
MPSYQFRISGSKPFFDADVQLRSSEAAWEEALRLVRDIEGSLQPGESWTLDVGEEGTTIFRISVTTEQFGRRILKDRLAGNARHPTGKSLRLIRNHVKPRRQKYLSSVFQKYMIILSPSRLHWRGVSRSSRT